MEIIKDFFVSAGRIFTSPVLSNEDLINFLGIFAVFVAFAIIAYTIYVAITKSKEEPPVKDHLVLNAIKERNEVLETQITEVGGLEGPKSFYNDLIKNLAERERYLLNICPLTANVGGYLGPRKLGVFHVDTYIRKALRAGVRCFILPISSYIDDNKRPPLFPFSGKPAIVFRDENGSIQSRNALTVRRFISSLLGHLYMNPGQMDEPILLFLSADTKHLPDPIKEEKAYVSIMRDLAEELNAIGGSAMKTFSTYGSLTGGRKEREILTEISLEDLKRKVLVATTFDTRLQLKDAYKNMRPQLFEQCNFLPTPPSTETTSQANVVTSSSGSKTSMSIRLMDVIGSKVNWKDQSRTALHACLQDSHLVMPTKEQVEEATRSGIQIIPIPFFYLNETNKEDVNMQTLKKIHQSWNGYGWRLKEKEARYEKPIDIKPKEANPAMNARAEPNLQGGQMSVK
jgi:hypothetical protein